MHQILNNDSLPLASHQEEYSLPVVVLARVDFLFVGSKVCVVHESGVVIMGSSEKVSKACIIIIILDMIIIIVSIITFIIFVIIRGSSNYATCVPLPSDTFHHHIRGRR